MNNLGVGRCLIRAVYKIKIVKLCLNRQTMNFPIVFTVIVSPITYLTASKYHLNANVRNAGYPIAMKL